MSHGGRTTLQLSPLAVGGPKPQPQPKSPIDIGCSGVRMMDVQNIATTGVGHPPATYVLNGTIMRTNK